MNNPTRHFILTAILFSVAHVCSHAHVKSIGEAPTNCDCDLYEDAPVCIQMGGDIIPYPNLCLATCDGFTTVDIVPCDMSPQSSCMCDPNIYDPVCVLLPGGIIPLENTIEYPNLCFATCDGFTTADIIPCDEPINPDDGIYSDDGIYPNDVIYPGDVNANGEVNHIDFLLLTTEYGKTGPARNVQNTSWDGWDYTSWNENFYETNLQHALAPSNLDIAMADANGDGIVEEQDIDVIYLNAGNTHPDVIPFDYPEGIEGQDPKLKLEHSITDAGEFAELELLISTEGYINDLQGMVFSIAFDETPDLFDTALDFSFDSSESWANTDGVSVDFFQVDHNNKRLNLGISRYKDFGSASGEGIVGKVSIIIGDVIILNQTGDDGDIKVENTYLLDGNKNNIPTVNGKTRIQSDPPTTEEPTPEPEPYEIHVFPNPSHGHVMFDFMNIFVYATIVTDQYGNIIAIQDGTIPEFHLWGYQPGYYHFIFQDHMGAELATRSVFLQ